MTGLNMKQCSLCKQTKSKNEFTKHSQKSDGLSSWCKICKREKDKQAAAKRKSFKADYDQVYNLANKDKIQKRGSVYREEHKSQKAQYDKEYRLAQGQARLEKKRNYYHTGGKAVQYKWMQENLDKVKAYQSTTCASRRKTITVGDTSKTISFWLSQQIKVCVYCGIACIDDFQIDHIEPIAKGGTHTIDNFAISCKNCNSSKSAKHLIHWLATRTN